MSDVLTGPWWRILSMAVPNPGGSAEDDYTAVHPAAVVAAAEGRPLVTGWLSRGDGAPLELITTAAPSAAYPGATPLPGAQALATPASEADTMEAPPSEGYALGAPPSEGYALGAPPSGGYALGAPPSGAYGLATSARRGKHAAPGPARSYPPPGPARRYPLPGPDDGSVSPASPLVAATSASPESPASSGQALLFPPGARAKPADGSLADLDRLVWVPCLARPETPVDRPEPGDAPGMFETALIALMRRPFGWLVVAEPTDLLAAETAGLRTELEILRRHEHRDALAEQTERLPAERGTFGAAGPWRVRVLAGAATPDELDVLAPLLAGAAELGPHPYRLRHADGAQSLDAALAARHHDPADGAQFPFFVTAGTLTALAGLPRLEVPGLTLTGGPPPAPAELARAAVGPADPPPTPAEPAPTPAEPAPTPAGPAPTPADSALVLAGPTTGPAGAAPDPGPPAGQDAAERDRGLRLLGAPVAAPALPDACPAPELSAEPDAPADLGAPAEPLVLLASGVSAHPEVLVDTAGAAAPTAPPATDRSSDSDGPTAPDDADDGAGRDPGTFELGVPLEAQGEPVRVPRALLRRGVLVAGSAGAGTARSVHQLLAQATEAGIPWLVIDPGGPGEPYGAHGATVINPVDPDAVPVTISPLAPAPGYPLHAHIALVSGLFDVAFGADEALSLTVAQALREVYLAAGWDLATGRPSGPVQVPDLGDLHGAIKELAAGSGYDRATRARLGRTADVRFGSLRDGSAGRFLGGGHPADVGELLRARIVVAVHDLAPAERALVTGTLLIRLAEHLRVTPRPGQQAQDDGPDPGLRHLLVLAEARTLLRDDGGGSPAARAAERFAALIAGLAAGGTGTVLTERRPALLTPDATRDPAVRIVHRLPARADQDAAGAAPASDAAAVVLTGEMTEPRPVGLPPEPADLGPPGPAWSPAARRSPACGLSCRTGRPCHLAELREAERPATSPEQAWLRVWTEVLVLAFLTDNPLPAVPAPLRRRWRGLATRPRECLLSHVAGHAVGRRATALRPYYDPARFTEVLAAAAASRLDHTAATAVRPGPAWVIPPLRWLHETERMCPLNGAGLATGDHAPPLDFGLPGLPDWPGIRVGQRIRALRRHPLSMALADNRRLAWTALVGEPGPEPFAGDLAQVLPGVDAAQALRHTAGLLEVSGGISGGPGWLEVVLSWPRRFVAFAGDRARPGDAADVLPG